MNFFWLLFIRNPKLGWLGKHFPFSVALKTPEWICVVLKTFLGRKEGRKGGRKEEVPVKGGMSLDWYHIKKQLFRPINFINIFHDIVNFFLPQNFEGSDASAQWSKERIWKQRENLEAKTNKIGQNIVGFSSNLHPTFPFVPFFHWEWRLQTQLTDCDKLFVSGKTPVPV